MSRFKMIRSDESGFAYEMENQPFSPDIYYDSPCVDVDQAKVSHKILGFGASFTDAACYMFQKVDPERRKALFQDLFSEDGLNLSIARLNIGASDYSTKVYSYHEKEDPELKDFTIEHDKKYIIPIVKEAQAVRPDMYLFSSPWSPPGWMKTGGSMCGGYMRAKYLPVFADYLVKYLQAYQAEGIHIDAMTMQNEPDTDQRGCMPQSQLHPDFEMELVGHLLPPRLKAAGLDTKMWLYDHNYQGWKRVLYMLSDPEVAANIDAVAWHPYDGFPEMMRPIREKYPDLAFQLTEKGPNYRKNSAESRLLWWSRAITGALNNGCSSFVGWNYALDENGSPNLGNFKCAGLVEIHSRTGEITPSIQYQAFKHYAPYLKRGAEVLSCPMNFPQEPMVDCLVARNPDGKVVAVVGNGADKFSSIQFKYKGEYLKIYLPEQTMTTIILG